MIRYQVFAAIVLSAAQLAVAQDAVPWARSIEEAQAQATREGRLVLVHFYSDNCPPCRKLEQNVFPQPTFGRAVASNYVPVKINADQQPRLAAKYGVRQWPTDIVLTAEGQQLTKATVSPQDPNKYIGLLDQIAARHRVRIDPSAVAMGQANPSRETNLVAYNQPMESTSFRPSATPNTYGAQPVPPPTSTLPPRQESNYGPAPYGTDSRISNANVYGGDVERANPQPQAGAYDPQGYRGASPYGGAASQTPPNTYGGGALSATGERPNPYRNNSSFQPERPGGAYVEGTPYHYPQQQYGRQMVQPQNPVSAINQASDPNSADPNRPTQSQLSGSMYGQPELGASVPPRDANVYGGGGAYGSPRETANVPSALPERSPGPNNSPYGSYAAQEPMAPPRDTERPAWQENPHQATLPGQSLPGQSLPDQTANRAPANPSVSPAPAPAGQDVRSSVSVAPPQGNPPLALEGFCPVTLMEGSKWNKGDVRFGAIHRGRTYLFASPAEQQKFLANPDQYSPMLSGYDPVAYLEQGKMVDGRRQCGIVHDGKMYLFTDEASLQRFCEAPDRFTGGVRQAMQQSSVPTTRR